MARPLERPKPINFEHSVRSRSPAGPQHGPSPPGTIAVAAPIHGKIVSIAVSGRPRARGQGCWRDEAMKMEHLVSAPRAGSVQSIAAARTTSGRRTDALSAGGNQAYADEESDEIDLDAIRPDLAESIARHAITLDENRPEAVARRRKTDQRTARENIADLCDPGSFIEYGALAVAAQRRRRALDDLIRNTPGRRHGHRHRHRQRPAFGGDAGAAWCSPTTTRCSPARRGMRNHQKTDRLFELPSSERLPVVLFAEGGGGRPGDTDCPASSGLDVPTFCKLCAAVAAWCRVVGIVSGRCFAGNAALARLLRRDHRHRRTPNIGMGGPAMIEGGGLGVFAPERGRPDRRCRRRTASSTSLVADEAEAVAVAKQLPVVLPGPRRATGQAPDQRVLRDAIPENRAAQSTTSRAVIEALADTGSVLELRARLRPRHGHRARPHRGPAASALIANNPMHLGGAIDATAADKAARFLQLCDAFGLPVVSLCDTPGFMVGPEAETTALVRHVARMFVTGASLTRAVLHVVLRKGYGLGAQAMAGGSFTTPLSSPWPGRPASSGRWASKARCGSVCARSWRRSRTPTSARQRVPGHGRPQPYEKRQGAQRRALFEIDDVIDPADTRRWIMAGFRSVPKPPPRIGRKRPCVDTW